MSVTVPATAASRDAIEQRFRELEGIWIRETGHLSSSAQIRNHPAFLEIINLGDAVVPYMLKDLQERPRLWVWALSAITGENPAAEADRGNIAKMSGASPTSMVPRDQRELDAMATQMPPVAETGTASSSPYTSQSRHGRPRRAAPASHR